LAEFVDDLGDLSKSLKIEKRLSVCCGERCGGADGIIRVVESNGGMATVRKTDDDVWV